MTAICPAMIDVLLHTLTRDASTQVNNSAMHDNALNVKELAVSVFIAVVQVLVLTSAGKVPKCTLYCLLIVIYLNHNILIFC